MIYILMKVMCWFEKMHCDWECRNVFDERGNVTSLSARGSCQTTTKKCVPRPADLITWCSVVASFFHLSSVVYDQSPHTLRVSGVSPEMESVVFAAQAAPNRYHAVEIYSMLLLALVSRRIGDVPSEYQSCRPFCLLFSLPQEMTEMFGYSVKDTVITVPEFATAHERRALLDAADAAGLTVLSLMDENTAAALQHAISQSYEEDTNVLFYNMGANSVQVIWGETQPGDEKTLSSKCTNGMR